MIYVLFFLKQIRMLKIIMEVNINQYLLIKKINMC